MFLDNTLPNIFRTGKQISERQSISLQNASGVSFNHRQARAGKDWCDGPFEQTINFSRLSKVSNLRCPTVISDGRQKIILDYGAQRNVWTELLRMGQGEF